MKPVRFAFGLHKWLTLLIGAQLLVWTASGMYMVTVHIDIIHGDMLVDTEPQVLGEGLYQSMSIADVLRRYPEASRLKFKSLSGRPVYEVGSADGRFLLDAASGEALTMIDATRAAVLASNYYAGDVEVAEVTLFNSDPPQEVKHLQSPVWRVDFDDVWGSSFYIDAESGALLSRRHTLWRIFDFLWMLHIMDYESREDVTNLLLRIATTLAMLAVLSGACLLYFRFRPRRSPA